MKQGDYDTIPSCPSVEIYDLHCVCRITCQKRDRPAMTTDDEKRCYEFACEKTYDPYRYENDGVVPKSRRAQNCAFPETLYQALESAGIHLERDEIMTDEIFHFNTGSREFMTDA